MDRRSREWECLCTAKYCSHNTDGRFGAFWRCLGNLRIASTVLVIEGRDERKGESIHFQEGVNLYSIYLIDMIPNVIISA